MGLVAFVGGNIGIDAFDRILESVGEDDITESLPLLAATFGLDIISTAVVIAKSCQELEIVEFDLVFVDTPAT